MTLIEWIAAGFGIWCVVLMVRQHIACWPIGLVQVALYVVVFYQAKLYSDMLLHLIYIGLQLHGWRLWATGGPRGLPLSVAQLPLVTGLRQGVTALVAAGGLGTLMDRFTDAALPYPDAFITVISLLAQWWMNRKWLQSWLAWIAVDLVAIAVYLAKDLYPTAALYVVFLGLSIWGYRAWNQVWSAAVTG